MKKIYLRNISRGEKIEERYNDYGSKYFGLQIRMILWIKAFVKTGLFILGLFLIVWFTRVIAVLLIK